MAAQEGAGGAKPNFGAMTIRELKFYLDQQGVDRSRCHGKAAHMSLAKRVAAEAKPGGRPGPRRPPRNEFCWCWQYFLPDVAPEWYVAKLGFGSSGDQHARPAPRGSLFLLGHVSLAVPDGGMARTLLRTGFGCGVSARAIGSELRMTAGASQIRMPVVEGQTAQRWPGELRLWVENIQTTYDMMTAVEGGLERSLVKDYDRGINGGEFSMKMIDPFDMNVFVLTEAPRGWARKLRDIGCEADSLKANAVAISDVMVKTRTRRNTQLLGGFYKHFFQAAVTIEQYSCAVHFSAGKELHQTLTFQEDESAPSYSNLGSICIYLETPALFHLAFTKCSRAGLVQPERNWVDVQDAREFVIRAVVDPASGEELLPMQHVIRSAYHADCVVPPRTPQNTSGEICCDPKGVMPKVRK